MMLANRTELNFMMIKNTFMNTPLFGGDGIETNALRWFGKLDLPPQNRHVSFVRQ